MIGYVCPSPSNDVYLYFEGGDIEAVKNGVVKGLFFDTNLKKLGDLEVSVGELDMELVNVNLTRKGDVVCGARAIISPRYYERFKESGSVGDHQGFRHVNLLDVSRFKRPMEELDYEQLIDAREKLSKDE